MFQVLSKRYSFNRTSMELKHNICPDCNKLYPAFNRTSMELKQTAKALIDTKLGVPFNRTSMELKHGKPTIFYLYGF